MAVTISGTPVDGGQHFGNYTVTGYSPGAGSNRAVVMCIANVVNSGTLTGITWGSSSDTGGQIILGAKGAPNSEADFYLYYCLEANLQSGSNIVMSFNNGGASARVLVITLSGVNQASPVNSTANDSQNSTPQTQTLSKSITIPSNGLAIGGVCRTYSSSDVTTTWNGSWASLIDADFFTDGHIAVVDSSTDTSIQATFGTVAEYYGLAAVAFNPGAVIVPPPLGGRSIFILP